MRIIGHKKLHTFVDTELLKGKSPASIAGRLRYQQKELPYVSKDSIYRYIASVYGRKIESARQKKKRHTKRPRVTGILDGRTFIDQRPIHINTRTRVGHAEFDFIVSGKGGTGILLVVVDRKLRVAFLEPIYVVTILEVHAAMLRIKKRYAEWKTGTTDNDLLFKQHARLAQELRITLYFCHPYHSWEKGSVENANGEIRVYFPKGSDVSKYPPSFFKEIENKINDRFMECLNFQTPTEALAQSRAQKNLRDVRRKKK
jgi:IS30 family transposase